MISTQIDVFISTDPSPRFAEMLRDYEAFANATNGSTTIAEVAAKHRKHQDSPQKPKVLAALDAVAAAGRAYAAVVVWRFDVQPLVDVTAWPVRAGAVSVPFREAAIREFPERRRPPAAAHSSPSDSLSSSYTTTSEKLGHKGTKLSCVI